MRFYLTHFCCTTGPNKSSFHLNYDFSVALNLIRRNNVIGPYMLAYEQSNINMYTNKDVTVI